MAHKLVDLLRPLQLPCEVGRESAVESALAQLLSAAGVAEDDWESHLSLLVDDWSQSSGPPEGELLGAARTSITAGMPNTGGDKLASGYRQLVPALMSHQLDLRSALGLISQAPFVHGLAAREQMSATQVARVVGIRLGGTFVPWQAAQKLLGLLGLRPELEIDAVTALLQSDIDARSGRFADASPAEAAGLVGSAAALLGFEGNCSDLLNTLCPPGSPSEAEFPYLQVIEFLSVVVEFYDHPVHYLYEFAPRGAVAAEIFARYPAGLVATANPILNNFKAVDAVDRSWAQGRSAQAHALASLLGTMSAMPPTARRELAAWLRQWVGHILELVDEGVALFAPGSASAVGVIERLVGYVTLENTATLGIAEQRLVDALSTVLHPRKDGWRSRGLGDAVNAANLPRRKLGDSDFQDTDRRRAVAYEPHGGRLSETYLDGHLRSLRRAIEARLEQEWLATADASDWSLELTFVAHEFDLDATSLRTFEMSGVTTMIRFRSFAEFATTTVQSVRRVNVAAAIERHFFEALNRRQTPQAVRDRIAEALGLELVSPSA